MLKFQIQELVDRYEKETGITLTPYRIAKDIGVSKNVIHRMIRNESTRTDLEILDKLIKYFRQKLKTKKLNMSDILRYSDEQVNDCNLTAGGVAPAADAVSSVGLAPAAVRLKLRS